MHLDIDNALRNMPAELRKKVREAVDKYYETGNRGYAELAISILEKFDDSSTREIIRTLRR